MGDTIRLLWLQHWWLTESCHDPKFTQYQFICSGIDPLMYLHCIDVIATRSVNSNCTSVLYKSLPLPTLKHSQTKMLVSGVPTLCINHPRGGCIHSMAHSKGRDELPCIHSASPSLDEALPKLWKECLVCWSRRVPHSRNSQHPIQYQMAALLRVTRYCRCHSTSVST